MIGAKKFEMEESMPKKDMLIKTKPPVNRKENEAALEKIKGPLLDKFKKNPLEQRFDSDIENLLIPTPLAKRAEPKVKIQEKKEISKNREPKAPFNMPQKESSKARESKAPFNMPPKEFFAPLLKKMNTLNKEREEKKEEQNTRISEEDINRISYKVFSNIRRYLDVSREQELDQRERKLKIEINL